MSTHLLPMIRVGLEPTTYGLKEPGGTLTSAHSRLIAGFDARVRSPALMGAVTMFVTDPRCVPDPEIRPVSGSLGSQLGSQDGLNHLKRVHQFEFRCSSTALVTSSA